jgi:hypothetical protein
VPGFPVVAHADLIEYEQTDECRVRSVSFSLPEPLAEPLALLMLYSRCTDALLMLSSRFTDA